MEGLDKTVEPWTKGMWSALGSVLAKLRAGQLWTRADAPQHILDAQCTPLQLHPHVSTYVGSFIYFWELR